MSLKGALEYLCHSMVTLFPYQWIMRMIFQGHHGKTQSSYSLFKYSVNLQELSSPVSYKHDKSALFFLAAEVP